MDNKIQLDESKKGLIYATTAFLIWGTLPIYWKMLSPINPLAIMFYRLLMAFVFVAVICIFKYGIHQVIEPIRTVKACGLYLLIGSIISLNWWLYIWMVNNGHILQTSIGYYINPLISCFIGFLVFKEKLDKYKISAFVLMGAGVIFCILYTGESPFFALVLAVSFAIYGALKKTLKVKPMLSLLYETMFLIPAVLPGLIYLEATGQGCLGNGTPIQYVLIVFAGAVTAIPLVLYAAGATKLPLMTLGMVQYISPTTTLLLGIFLFHESLNAMTLVTFVLIWIGLAVFTYGEYRIQAEKNRQQKKSAAVEVPSI